MKKLVFLVLGISFSITMLPFLVSAAVSVPKPLAPANGAKNYNANVTSLQWTKIPNAEYQLRFKNGSSSFGESVHDLGGANYARVIMQSLGATNDGGTYYWQVRAKDLTSGDYGSWSPVFRFTTIKVPDKAILLFPNSYTISKNSPKDFSWKIGSNTVFSNIIIYNANQSSGECEATQAIKHKIKGTRVSSNILLTLNPGKYCWTVETCGNAGCAATATPYKFNLTEVNFIPNLLFSSPNSFPPVFYWEKFGDGEATIQFSIKKDFSSDVISASTTNNYFLAEDSTGSWLAQSAGYTVYWRVKGAGDWSKIASFKKDQLTKPGLIYPANNAVNFIATSSTFRWGRVSGATFYKMDISKDGYSKTIYSSAPSYKILSNFGLATSTAYTWKVTAYNNNTESLASDNFTFTTK